MLAISLKWREKWFGFVKFEENSLSWCEEDSIRLVLGLLCAWLLPYRLIKSKIS